MAPNRGVVLLLLGALPRAARGLASPQSLLRARGPAPAGLSFEEVARLPRPGSSGVTSASFSPAGDVLTYLASGDGSLLSQLYAVDVATGATTVAFAGGEATAYSAEEQMRRERARVMATGVTSYAWAAEADVLLVPADGALYVKRGAAGAPRRLLDAGASASFVDVGTGPLLDPAISDDGSVVAFVWDDEVCAVDVDGGGPPRRLTFGARGVAGVTDGVADYCAMEEMDRYSGFWLSPGRGARVAYESVDERGVAVVGIPRPCDPSSPGAAESHRYPFAGEANPFVRLLVADTAGDGKAPVDLDLGAAGLGDDVYLARVAWADERTVLATVQSRDQRTLRVVAFDSEDGSNRVVLEDTSDAWLNLNDALQWTDGELLFASERDGLRSLYVADGKGGTESPRRVTEGLLVEEVVAFEGGAITFLGSDVDAAPLERRLYRVPYDGSAAPERLAPDATYVDAAAVKNGALFLQHSSAARPVRAELRVRGEARVLRDAADDGRCANLAPPEFFETRATDGTAALRGALYVPDAAVHGPGPYPAVVSCYGGPHVQFVADRFATATADLRAQGLRARGYLVVKLDGRGSDRRGPAFEAAVRGRLGSLEVDDQVAGVSYAVDAGLADPDRVGVYGWSYGGYLSAMCLAKAPGVFRCAVAGAPVAGWEAYDTHYTERYMGGGPAENPDGYRAADVCAHVAGIRGALLLVHGLIDENVLFRHTARIAQACIEHGKHYELLCFPNERHSPRSEKDRAYQEARAFHFLETWLAPESGAPEADEA